VCSLRYDMNMHMHVVQSTKSGNISGLQVGSMRGIFKLDHLMSHYDDAAAANDPSVHNRVPWTNILQV
jgi:hypothetical protein